jgi:hypothetical protein
MRATLMSLGTAGTLIIGAAALSNLTLPSGPMRTLIRKNPRSSGHENCFDKCMQKKANPKACSRKCTAS